MDLIDEGWLPAPTMSCFFGKSDPNVLANGVKQFKSVYKVSPNTIVLNTKWAMKVRSAFKDVKMALEIWCENDLSPDENEFALVWFPPDDGDGGEEIDIFDNVEDMQIAV